MVLDRPARQDGAMSSIWTIRRSATDAKLTGLCGGVAEHWGIDPVLVRVGWVLLALSGGVGVVLYVAGWLLVPVQGRTTAPVDDLLGDVARRWSKEVWVALVLVACVVVFTAFGGTSPFGVGPALVIGGIWYFGFAKHRQPKGPASPPPERGTASVEPLAGPPSFLAHPGPSTPFTEAADAWRRRIEEHVRVSGGASVAGAEQRSWPLVPTGPTPAALQDPDPEQSGRTAFLAEADPVGLYVDPPVVAGGAQALPRRRGDRVPARRLRLLTLLVLGLTSGGLALADQRGLDVPPAVYAATALLVVGLALVAATWFGRARGLLALGLLLVPVVAVASVVGPHGQLDRWTRVSPVYTDPAQLPPAGDVLPGGALVVDLRGLTFDTDTAYSAHVGTGRLEVIVPPDADVALRYRVDQGVVMIYGQEAQFGTHLVEATPPTAALADAPTLTLDLSVDRGQLEVRR
jgi:phage shock protein PspC (stress-responsive transcriptional regulator)